MTLLDGCLATGILTALVLNAWLGWWWTDGAAALARCRIRAQRRHQPLARVGAPRRRARRDGLAVGERREVARRMSRLMSGHAMMKISVPCMVPITCRQRAGNSGIEQQPVEVDALVAQRVALVDADHRGREPGDVVDGGERRPRQRVAGVERVDPVTHLHRDCCAGRAGSRCSRSTTGSPASATGRRCTGTARTDP